MKRIILVRHAKSSWENPDWSDFERPLNKRGLRDAPFMADIVAKKIEKPDLIISSPAVRAATTCKYFAKAFSYNEKDIIFDENIYSKGSRYIINLIFQLDSNFNSVMIFGHNPDITSLFAYFTGEYIDNIPTCGVFAVEFDIKSWKEIENNNGKLIFYEYPKKYFPKDANIVD
jgi:phosphohistidine phosphatase